MSLIVKATVHRTERRTDRHHGILGFGGCIYSKDQLLTKHGQWLLPNYSMQAAPLSLVEQDILSNFFIRRS